MTARASPRMFVGPAEVRVGAPARALVEMRGFPHQVFSRFVQDFFASVRKPLAGDAAGEEFRIEPVSAFSQLAAVRHLRDDGRGAEQAAEQLVAERLQAYFVHRTPVTHALDPQAAHLAPPPRPTR